MPGVRDIRRRIRSVENTKQITKAMNMVAAAKLRTVQGRLLEARPYSNKLWEVAQRIISATPEIDHPLVRPRERVERIAYVLITSDRGLCGGYNVNISRLAQSRLDAAPGGSVIAVGRKGRDYLRRRGYRLEKTITDIGDLPNYIQTREIAREMVELFSKGTYDEVYVLYTEFINAVVHRPNSLRLLPLEPSEQGLASGRSGAAGSEAKVPEKEAGAGTGAQVYRQAEYLFEPSASQVLEVLLPRLVEAVVYRTFLEAKASEHGARMTAMDNATENAEEMVQKLTLTYNRARQAAITKELADIVGTAQAIQ